MKQLHAGIDFLAFRPSVTAAAIALLVLGEIQNVDVQKALSCCSHVAKVKQFYYYFKLKTSTNCLFTLDRKSCYTSLDDFCCLRWVSAGRSVGML